MSDTTTEITNMEDVIDSRDVIARIEYLRELPYSGLSRESSGDPEMRELQALRLLADEAADYSEDWEYGATLIRDSYFKEYAQELAEEVGAVPTGASWPAYCIDWEWAARELQQDYTAVTFDGVTYWVR